MAAVSLGFEELGLGELVELLADGVGREAELLGQLPEIGPGGWIEEEAHQELDAGFGGYESGKELVHWGYTSGFRLLSWR